MFTQSQPVKVGICIAFLMMLLGPPALAKSPLDGSINVINKRGVSVQITVDGKPVGQVAARGLRTFKNIPNGLRIVSVRSGNAKTVVSRIQVPVTGRVSYTVVRPHGRIRVSVSPRYLCEA